MNTPQPIVSMTYYTVCCVDPKDVSEEDLKELSELGFEPETDYDYTPGFYSYRYGSC